MDQASDRETRRWWLLWRRRRCPVGRAQAARITAVVAREGRLGGGPGCFLLRQPEARR